MINDTQNLDNYIEVMNKIEVFIQKATQNGVVDTLSKEEFDALNELSLMANAYEKNMREGYLSQPTWILHNYNLQELIEENLLPLSSIAQIADVSEEFVREMLKMEKK